MIVITLRHAAMLYLPLLLMIFSPRRCRYFMPDAIIASLITLRRISMLFYAIYCARVTIFI